MPLEIGSTLGVYQVTAAIGAGGMGEVYKARDTKLDRDVALKILPDAFVNDPERLARFQREAKVLASLNHPNIAAIYGLEDEGESPALVLEYVEGPTLQDRIAQGPIPLDDALPIARQICRRGLNGAGSITLVPRQSPIGCKDLRPDCRRFSCPLHCGPGTRIGICSSAECLLGRLGRSQWQPI